MRTINEGDDVIVWFSGGERMTGKVMHSPSNPGDLWFIRRDDGADIGLNPQAQEFCTINKVLNKEVKP